ncbi:zinc ribbon domain-containing protein [Dactylosporangium sp. CA-233914]|uniref:zinc ribbon domain-containing protein n=1 Tax=Dactylosporangium sp. CA-233914 TaxID=3239934 RepID=UPI003D936AC7
MTKLRHHIVGHVPVTATATCTSLRGVEVSTGRVLNAAAVAERVALLCVIVRDMTRRLLDQHWTAEAVAAHACGVDAAGQRLPSNGWMAQRRLGMTATAPTGMVVSDRVRRIAEEHAARLLRLAVHRDRLLSAVTSTWPADPGKRSIAEWDALRAAAPEASTAEIRNRTRQVAAFLAGHGRLPSSITEAEPVPRVSGQVLLAAADKQQVTVARDIGDPRRLALRVLLPTVEHPASYRDWAWVILDANIPATVPVAADLASPTLRLVHGRVRVDLPWTRPAPVPAMKGHRRALGLDWGYNTLLTGAVGRLGEDRRGRARVITDGRPLTFDATGVSAKLERLRTHREHVRARLDHYQRLLAGRPDETLAAKRAVLQIEAERINARYRNLNKALAWNAARWAVDHALANRCTVISIEDLTTLETRGLGRSMNRRLSGHVRGQVFDALRHLAVAEGIAVVTVPARGTSTGCPRCGRYTTEAAKGHAGRHPGFRHVRAPNRPTKPGHKWSVCACGLSTDRDHAAAERILARGLLGQAHAYRDRKTGRIRTARTVDGPVRRIPKPRSPQAAACNTTPLTPVRREVPALVTPPRVTGQRPAGRPPQTCSTITGQVPTAKAATRTRADRIHSRRLSRGFHRHVTATPHTRPAPRHSLP